MVPSQRVAVYWNSKRKCYSVLHAGRRVARHVRAVWLSGCVFHVWPSGRERTRRTGGKTVHAFVRGGTMRPPAAEALAQWTPGVEVRYDPFRDEEFVCAETGEAVRCAMWVQLSSAGGRARVVAYNAC